MSGKYNYYCVAIGKNPETGEEIHNMLFTTWEECKPYINNVTNAKYKGFFSLDEAKIWAKKVHEKIDKKKAANDAIPEKAYENAEEKAKEFFGIPDTDHTVSTKHVKRYEELFDEEINRKRYEELFDEETDSNKPLPYDETFLKYTEKLDIKPQEIDKMMRCIFCNMIEYINQHRGR